MISEAERKSAWLAGYSAAVAGLSRPNEEGEIMAAEDIADAAVDSAELCVIDYVEQWGGRGKKRQKGDGTRRTLKHEDTEEEDEDE